MSLFRNFIIKKSAVLSLLLIFTAIILTGCVAKSQVEVTAAPAVTAEPTIAPTATIAPTSAPTAVPQPIEIVIGGTGDIMVHKRQLMDAQYTATFEEGYEYYFEHNFKYIKPALEYPDLMLGNLEVVFGSLDAGEYDGFPRFNTPDSMAAALKNAGFDVLTNANNHAVDQGKEGLLRTISVLEENGFYHTGTFESVEDYNTPLIIDVNGVKVGILAGAYAYQNIGKLTKEEQKYMISLSSEEYLKAEVEDLKNAGAQIIVASMHWGYEYYYEIYDDQAELAPVLVKAGVDIIFGHHPHILQPIQYMEVTLDDGTTNSAVVCWSLGNFLANTPMRLEKQGAICYVHLSFDPVTEEVTITNTQVLPVYIFWDRSYLYDYHVLPALSSIESLNIDDFDVPDNFQSTIDKKYSDIVGSITDEYVEFLREFPEK